MEEITGIDPKRDTFICVCHSLEHQISFWHDTEENELYCYPSVISGKNFFRRIVLGTKYIFGISSKEGHFPEILIKPEDVERLEETLSRIKQLKSIK